MSDHDNLIFRGIDSAECEEFIRSVRRVALSRGKQNDNAWIAQYAGACFGGAALRWYERLGDDVQDDWKRLRIAMLDRWPEDGNDDDLGAEPSFSATVPTPPAAAPPPIPARRPMSKSESENLSHVFENLSLTTRRGLVRLETLDGKFYVYQTRNSSGSFGTTSRREYALSVEYDVGPPPHRIKVRNVDKCSWLAVKWNSTVAIGAGATKPVGLVALDDSDAFQSYDTNRRKWKGPQRSVVWSVASDGTLQAFWEEGATCVLSALWRPTDHLIMLVADPESYVAKYPHWKQARLVFEAVQ